MQFPPQACTTESPAESVKALRAKSMTRNSDVKPVGIEPRYSENFSSVP